MRWQLKSPKKRREKKNEYVAEKNTETEDTTMEEGNKTNNEDNKTSEIAERLPIDEDAPAAQN